VRWRTLHVCASAHAHRLPRWALAPDLPRASETVVRLTTFAKATVVRRSFSGGGSRTLPTSV